MLPSKLEYLFLLAVLSLIGLSLFWERLLILARLVNFWLSSAIFLSMCTVIDHYAITLKWWTFSTKRTCGATLLGIPIEEFLLFILFFAFTVCLWEDLRVERG